MGALHILPRVAWNPDDCIVQPSVNSSCVLNFYLCIPNTLTLNNSAVINKWPWHTHTHTHTHWQSRALRPFASKIQSRDVYFGISLWNIRRMPVAYQLAIVHTLKNHCLGGWLGFLTQLLKMLDHFSCCTLFHCRDILTLYPSQLQCSPAWPFKYLVFHGSPSPERRIRCYPLTEQTRS